MPSSAEYRPIPHEVIQQLSQQGCRAADWKRVRAGPGFDADRVHRVVFEGDVRIGSLAGSVRSASGLERPCGIESARIIDCAIGDGVRIADVRAHLAGYRIDDGACVEDVGVMQTDPGATFGNGLEVDVVNEAGGREVMLFNALSSQFAHLLCLHRDRPAPAPRVRFA